VTGERNEGVSSHCLREGYTHGQCDHVCGNIKLITKNSEKGKREKEKRKGFITDLVGGLFLNVK
jgi:hypothetical protein